MTNGMPIGTGIPFPQGIQSDSACPRLEDTLASTVGTKAIHRLRGRWRGPERFGRSDAFLDYRRVSLLVPLRQQEFCPGPALGMGAERVFRAGRCSHHRLQGAFLPAWYRCDRRGRRHQGHGRNRSLGNLHRFGLDNLTIPMLHFLATRASAHQGSTGKADHQQGAAAQRPKQCGIGPGLRGCGRCLPFRRSGCSRRDRLC